MLNPADTEFEMLLRQELGSDVFREISPDLSEEPRGQFHGRIGLHLAPGTTDEVATILRACNAARVGVLPYSGGTGLVGGQVMPDGPAPVLLSLRRMNRLRDIYPLENVMVVEAGMILADAQDHAEHHDRLFPLSLAAEGSARIGGNLGTNAGGVNVLRYGNARDLVLGLEVVFASGEVWHGLSRLRKDNTGYDLRNLMIGSEGTLGVITAAALKLFPRPAERGVALLQLRDPGAALELLAMATRLFGQQISAFELISGVGLGFLQEVLPDIRQPFADPPDWCALIEIGLTGAHADEGLETLFAEAHEAGLVSDGLIAQSEEQRRDFWNLRENIPEANRRIGAISSQDISLPLGTIPEFIQTARREMAQMGDFRINCFGHLGDGNLHFNIFPAAGKTRADYPDAKMPVRRALHDLTHAMGGSFSAEHGVGRLKVEELERYGDPARLSAMRAIKAALDPVGIMNPGAVLR